MFYEMCFPFATNMERIHVLKDLRLKEMIINPNIISQKQYEKQVEFLNFLSKNISYSNTKI